MDVQEYLGLRDNRAFSMLVIAGFSAILVGAVFLIIGVLVVNSIGNVVEPTLGAGIGGTNATTTMNSTYQSVITSIGQAFVIGGVSLIVVGVAVIIAVLFGMVGGGAASR